MAQAGTHRGTFEFARTARERFAKSDRSVKKKQILLAVSSNLALKDKKLSIEAKKRFLLVESCCPGHACENQTFEPDNALTSQGRNGDSASDRLNLCASRDDVRTSRYENKELVKSIYAFFRAECLSPAFRLSDWNFLFHKPSMNEVKK